MVIMVRAMWLSGLEGSCDCHGKGHVIVMVRRVM